MILDELLERILYRDAMMLVLNKPAGIAVHPGFGKKQNLQSFFNDLQFGLPNPPALAHRLDAATSGCLVLGRHRQALNRLGDMFANGKIEKTYWAVVKGGPTEKAGRIDISLSKQSAHSHRWWMKADPNGQQAITDYRVLGETEDLTWLELKPLTGRTHQLRVHCQAMGWPIVGDMIYGGDATDFDALHLHARAIHIPLYPKKDPVFVEASPPIHMEQALKLCGFEKL
ncbi:MAG: RNA pseudouridine synthase [Alphaproteobacteria bacterium]|nr:RNA pseudouridine synthase [Alphaproteobacteria bacterium]